ICWVPFTIRINVKSRFSDNRTLPDKAGSQENDRTFVVGHATICFAIPVSYIRMSSGKIRLEIVIEGCLSGNPLSQRRLYEHFYGYGMSICQRYTRHQREAEEVLNDGFLKIFFNLDQYNPARPLKPWIRRILINTAIDHYRQRKELVFTTAIDHLSDHELPALVPPVEPHDEVLPILQQLTPAYRLVFNLYVMEGYKHHEIAELLGISTGTSKSNLARAKAQLQVLWAEKKSRSFKMRGNG
ncbi:MAG: RNA polymerase sigma factor, partial [Saprospiraceae bacterium]|nr:RNA polymerase sigma factor [Saprospiraceae bacterium]